MIKASSRKVCIPKRLTEALDLSSFIGFLDYRTGNSELFVLVLQLSLLRGLVLAW